MDFFEELLKRITTKAEVGVACLGFVIGYALDLELAISAVRPLTAGALGAVAAVGFKNTVQSIGEAISSRRAPTQERKKLQAKIESGIAEVERLAAGRNDSDLARLAQAVQIDHELWQKNLVEDVAVRQRIDEFVRVYRTGMLRRGILAIQSEEAGRERISLDAPVIALPNPDVDT